MSQPSPAPEPDFAAWIAIDWADREHAWSLQMPGSTHREKGTLKHTPEAIEQWACALAQRFAGRPVAVALEQSRGALLYALRKYAHFVLYAVHPSTSFDYRKAMHPSGSKDDPEDADLLLDLLVLHRDRLRMLQPDTEQTRKLQALVEQRRQLVDERTAQTNRITNQLKLYFPQVLEWLADLSAPIVAAFLERWPTLPEVQKAAPEQVRAFFYEQGSRSTTRSEQRLQHIERAQPLLTDAAVIEPGRARDENAAGHRGGFKLRYSRIGKGHPTGRRRASGLRHFCFLSRSRAGAGAPVVSGLREPARTLHKRPGATDVQRHRSGDAG